MNPYDPNNKCPNCGGEASAQRRATQFGAYMQRDCFNLRRHKWLPWRRFYCNTQWKESLHDNG